jgi:hypothetical protein
MKRKYKWIRMTIHEPFPVFARGRHRSEPNQHPFYSANSEWFKLYTERNWNAEQRTADYWRERGYTVSLDTVMR